MKKDLRILFMGSPDFAVESLRQLVEHEFNIVGVVTAQDKPAGRGQKLRKSAVKQFAVANDIPVLQPKNLKAESFQRELEQLNANLYVVVAFRMLPAKVFEKPELGCFNLHASLLPQYRGAAPINWAVINGETKTGATTFFLKQKIDTGDIILQDEVPIYETDCAGDLHDRLMVSGASLVVKTCTLIASGKAESKPQELSGQMLKKAPKIFREDCEINWNQTSETVYNFIRGLSPYPGAWTTLDNKTFKIYSAEKKIKQHATPPGEYTHNKEMLAFYTQDGLLICKEI